MAVAAGVVVAAGMAVAAGADVGAAVGVGAGAQLARASVATNKRLIMGQSPNFLNIYFSP
jgi:hypothetical protein